MNEENERFTNRLLVLFTTFVVLFTAFVCFIFIGIAKVDAKSYAWETPNLVQFRNGNATSNIETGSTVIISKSKVTFLQNLDSELLSTQFNARYNIADNTSNNDVYFSKDDYKISLRFRIAFFSDSAKTINVSQLKLWYYRPSSKVYNTMTCDGEQSFKFTKMSNVDYIIEYECSSLNFTYDDIAWVAYSYYNPSPMTLWQNSQNLHLISTSDSATNNDIISNDDKNTNNIINNQNQNQQQTNDRLDDINNSITNSDTSSSSNSLSGFFGNFKDSDNGGLSAIITAPLVAINKVLDNSCPSLDGSYQGQSFSIPSGCTFWNRIPQVKDVANVISGGFLCYLILRKMFLLIHQLKNPTDDRVEVMNL